MINKKVYPHLYELQIVGGISASHMLKYMRVYQNELMKESILREDRLKFNNREIHIPDENK